jgi:hypothetical protein
VRFAGAALVLASALAILILVPGGRAGNAAHPGAARWQDASFVRSAQGTLWLVDSRCRTGRVDFADRRLLSGPANYCDLWPAPDGQTVIASRADADPPSPPARLVILDRSMRLRAATSYDVDQLRPPVAWSPGSSLAAVCSKGRSGPPRTVLVDTTGVARLRLGPVCHPAYLLTDTLVASDGWNVFIGQAATGIQGQLAAAIHSPLGGYVVEALAAGSASLAISVAHRGGAPRTGAVVVFGRTGSGSRTVPVTRGGYASELGVAPNGLSFWYRGATTGDETLVGNGLALPRSVPRVARSYAWSPDSRLLAVAQNGGIGIYDLSSGRHVTIGGVDPTAVSWTL